MKKIIALLILAAMLVCSLPVGAAEADDSTMKVLFIGNSYSDDATDGGYFEDSTLYAMLESMVGKGNAAVGLIWSGGKTMAWHASMAKKNSSEYSFFYNDSTDGWNYIGARSTADALAYTDWDVVVLQPYGQEVTLGYSSSIDGILSEFSKIEDSTPYMIDHVAKNAPDADIYLYMPLSATNDIELNAGYDDYKSIAGYMREIETYTGTESGKGFSGVIATGAAIQAARNTYLALLDYNARYITVNNIMPNTDPQMGLQRDGVHLSFSIGRYIANLMTAETLVPAEKRLDGYVLPAMRVSEAVGEMPDEYMTLARLSVDAAHASAANKGNAKYVIRKLTGYETSPLAAISGELDTLTVGAGQSAAETEANIAATVRRTLGADVDVKVSLGDYTPPTSGELNYTDVTLDITHGYESIKVTSDITVKPGVNVTVNVSGGGRASEEGKITLPAGGGITVSFTPDEGCRVLDVVVDGQSKGSVSSISLENLTADVTLEVKFGVDNPFTDVQEGKWYYEGVLYVASKGYMKGTNTEMTLFSPSMEFTREQFVQLLFNMEGVDKDKYAGDTGFTDVPAGKWYSAAVKWANEAGVTSGIGDGKFGLGGKVSREQLARFLMNYADMKGNDTKSRAEIKNYTDAAKVSSWATDAVSWAVAEGLIGSTSTTALTLAPKRIATRAEIAKITMSYDAYLAK